MDWPFYLFVGLVAAMYLVQFYIARRARRAEGRAAPDTAAVDGAARQMPRRVHYFYAPHCGPCRAMTPLVARMQAAHPNLVKINVEESQELSRAFNIAATPSFVLVEDGVIRRVHLGAQSEKKLLKMLQAAEQA